MPEFQRFIQIMLRAGSGRPQPWARPLDPGRVLGPGLVGGLLFVVFAELLRATGLLGQETALFAIFAIGLITIAGGIPAGFLALGLVGAYMVGSQLIGLDGSVRLRTWFSAGLALGVVAGVPAYWHWRDQRLARFETAQRSRLDIFHAQFEALCEAVHHGVFVADPNGRVTHANARFRAMCGLAPGDALPADAITGTIHPDERLRVRDEWRVALERGEEFSSEHRMCGRRGAVYTMRVFAAPVAGPEGHCGYVGTVEDVTELKSVEDQLLASERRLQTITDNVPAMISYIDRDERFQFINRAYEEGQGRKRSDMMGRRLDEVLSAADMRYARPMLERARAGVTINSERPVTHADGRTIWLQTAVVPHRAPDGDIIGFFAMSTDITSRREAEEALHREKERAQVTLCSISDAVIRTDGQGRIEYLNPTAQSLTGWPASEAVGLPVEAVLRLKNEANESVATHPLRAAIEADPGVPGANLAATLFTPEGKSVPVDLSVAPIRGRDGTLAGTVAVFRDASAQRRLARRLAYQATHDTLTGLRNRRGLAEALDTALARKSPHCLLYLDLDRFKPVNDACGHAAGDEVLRQVATSLARPLRAADTLARVGGDEFVVLLEGASEADAQRVAETMRGAIESLRFPFKGTTYRLGVSIGVAAIEEGSPESAEALIAAADAACYSAKAAGRNRVVAFERRAA